MMFVAVIIGLILLFVLYLMYPEDKLWDGFKL